MDFKNIDKEKTESQETHYEITIVIIIIIIITVIIIIKMTFLAAIFSYQSFHL